MKVVTFETTDGKERYLLVDAGGVPIEEVRLFLKFEDNRGLARNTLKQQSRRLSPLHRLRQPVNAFQPGETADTGSPGSDHRACSVDPRI